MALISLNVCDTYGSSYKTRNEIPSFSEEHTYCIIFGPRQDSIMKQFKEKYQEHIIFESKRAYNKRYSSEHGARNTLIIVEKKKETASNG